MRPEMPDGTVGGSTFTQRKRRDQLVDSMIDAIAELGFPRASVAEVARRAGVSKGVVTYHFAAKDDLIQAVIADVLSAMSEHMGTRLVAAEPARFPEKFVAAYLAAWVDFYRTHGRELLALVRIYNGFRDESGRPNPAFGARADDIAAVTQVLELGQARGSLGSFDARILATVIKAALDDLLIQYADDPGIDLEAYGAELVSLFEQASRAPAAEPSPRAT